MEKINKAILLLAMLLVLTISVLATQYTAAQETGGLNTDRGTISIHPGTLIGGDYTENFAVLQMLTPIDTEEEGVVQFSAGTKIDCEPPPGYPDNCNP